MGQSKKDNKGPLLCDLCDRRCASTVGMQQHVRDKHPDAPIKAPTVKVDPPVEKPRQVEVQAKPEPTPTTTSLGKILCEHCLARFPSPEDLKRHNIASHPWPCMKCPTLPPFKDGAAWQIHFSKVHAASVQSGVVKDTKKSEHRSYPCPKCPEIFKTEVAVNEHAEQKHKPPPPPPAKPLPQRSASDSGKPDHTKDDGVKSPPRAPATEATEKTTPSVTNPNQDQEVALTDRFYCQDEDCGRGFSTQGILDTHVKFFHPKKGDSSLVTPKGTVSVGGTPDDAKGKVGGAKLPVQHTSGLSPVTAGSDSKDVSTDIATQFRCRICDKPPSAETRPAATFCGHLFCYKCIMTKVTSTSKCPVCSTSTLADRIFELDISC